MNGRTWCALLTALLAQLPSHAGSAAAQQTSSDSVPAFNPVRWEWGVDLVAAKAVGDFSEHVEGGGGFGISGIRYFGDGAAFGVRVDLMLISYGKATESYRIGLGGTDLDVDMTTENVIATFAAGPQVVLGRGRLRPYLGASVGSAQFVTTTAAWAGGRALPIADTEVLKRHALALSAGGGVRLAFREQKAHPISLELDGRYRRHGRVEYLREGGLRELPDGSVELDLITSDANLWTISIGGLIAVR